MFIHLLYMMVEASNYFSFDLLFVRRSEARSGYEIHVFRAVYFFLPNLDEEVAIDEATFVSGHLPTVAFECLIVVMFVLDDFAGLRELKLGH